MRVHGGGGVGVGPISRFVGHFLARGPSPPQVTFRRCNPLGPLVGKFKPKQDCRQYHTFTAAPVLFMSVCVV